MKDKILEIVEKNPKHYTRLIKNNPEFYEWVIKNTLINSDKLSEMIYSAIYNVSNICENGGIKKFDRWSTGFTFCGPASSCICTKESISKNVSISKSQISSIDKEKTNIKRKKTMVAKYGVEYNSQREDVKPMLTKPKMDARIYNMLNDLNWLNSEYVIKKRTSVDISIELGIHNSTVIEYLKKHGFDIRQRSSYSQVEVEIIDYIKSICDFEIIENTRSIIPPYELDIYIKDINFAIEVNGLYWHSTIDNKNKHIIKTELCRSKNVYLMHITDWEWNNKKDIIKSIIISKLNKSTKIYARKCSIVELNTKQAKEFFNKNHLQGFTGAESYIGLSYNNEIVMCMSFGKNRFLDGIELIRMAATLQTTIVGGASKILSYYTKKYNVKNVLTYCDYSKSYGNSYKKIGFVYKNKSKLGYFWTDGNQILSRYKTQKHKLHKLLGDKFNINLSETQNMINNGYKKYWDCGNLIFEYNTI